MSPPSVAFEAARSSVLGHPEPLIFPNKDGDDDHNLKPLQNQEPLLPLTPSSPPPHLHPKRALPPKSQSRVAFDLNATRRYSSAPYSLSTTTYTPQNYIPDNQTRHTSLSLGLVAPEADYYMPTGRPRGESDLSRPSQLRGNSHNGYGVSITKGINDLIGSGGGQDKSSR